MENALFGVNHPEWTIFEKMCRNSMFFASVTKMIAVFWQTEAESGLFEIRPNKLPHHISGRKSSQKQSQNPDFQWSPLHNHTP